MLVTLIIAFKCKVISLIDIYFSMKFCFSLILNKSIHKIAWNFIYPNIIQYNKDYIIPSRNIVETAHATEIATEKLNVLKTS